MYHLTASARYNYSKVDNKDKLTAKGLPESLTEDFTFNRINPAIGLSVTPSKDFSFYGRFKFRLGHANDGFYIFFIFSGLGS